MPNGIIFIYLHIPSFFLTPKPAYWLSIIVAIITFLCLSKSDISKQWNYILGNLFMVQPLFKSGNLVDAYWTLYIELCFYFFASLVWFFRYLNKIEPIILSGLLIVLIVNGLYLLLGNSSSGYVRFFIISRSIMPLVSYFGFFASGIIYYKIYKEGWNTYRLILLAFSFLLTILIHNISGRFNLFFGTFERVICLAFFNILFVLIVNKKAGFLKVKWLLFIGTLSYALYLIHESFGITVSVFLFDSINRSLAVICGVITSICAATLITFLFERRIQKWLKKKYMPQ
ncbi:MAG TPA: acyltransferase family protein [Mucilaginibacter sp.]|nr:acyltransferase family protein [Mucilaginibacter sp.]